MTERAGLFNECWHWVRFHLPGIILGTVNQGLGPEKPWVRCTDDGEGPKLDT